MNIIELFIRCHNSFVLSSIIQIFICNITINVGNSFLKDLLDLKNSIKSLLGLARCALHPTLDKDLNLFCCEKDWQIQHVEECKGKWKKDNEDIVNVSREIAMPVSNPQRPEGK